MRDDTPPDFFLRMHHNNKKTSFLESKRILNPNQVFRRRSSCSSSLTFDSSFQVDDYDVDDDDVVVMLP